MPGGWRIWSHGDEASMYRSALGVERPQGMVLIERCCGGAPACAHCAPEVAEAVAG